MTKRGDSNAAMKEETLLSLLFPCTARIDYLISYFKAVQGTTTD